MANSSGTTSCSDMKLLRKPSFVMEMKKQQQQPLMLLKDFLIRDDFSSCSSNGFKSFPRRQCCTATTVRYLLDRDLNRPRDSSSTNSSSKQRLLKRSRSSKAAAISALQRASVVVLNAVKYLPFASVHSRSSSSSSVQNYTRKGLLLPRSFSRKLLKRSFWKKTENGGREIQRLRSFSEFLKEKEQPSDSITVTTDTTAITTTTTTTTTTTSSSSKSNSWSGSEFTSDYLQCSSGNSESFGENDAVGGKKNSPEKKDSKRVGGDSMEKAASTISYCIDPNVVKKGWPTEEEKEQFSPVSVLDCPFDDEEEICSPFRHRLARMEGKKQKLMQNIRRFESLAQLEPMDLEKRMALSEVVDDSESLESPNQFDVTSTMAMDTATFEKIEKEIKTEQKAEELLNIIKTKIPSDSSKYKSDKLILDFFRDRIEGRFVKPSGGDEQLLKVAEDWVNGKPHEVLLDWQVQDGRKAYIRDMEEEGEWRIEGEEKEEVGLEVEVEVWTCLVNELVFDVFFR